MLYFAHISSIFRQSSLDELSKIAKFRLVDENLSAIIIETSDKNLQKKAEKSIFTYCAFPISDSRPIKEKNYLQDILSAIKSLKIDKSKKLKLECIDINERHGYSAKDIEVKTGLALEKLKYNINIIDPEILAYVVLLNGKCYSGYVDFTALSKKFVNPMRYYHTKKSINRSELKLREAFDEFNLPQGGVAIDLGAAPGGWSHFMAQKGYKVVAIDNGDLNYSAIRAEGVKIAKVSAEKQVDSEKLFKTNDIIHIKSGFKGAKKALKLKNADLLTDDMNIFCSDTTAAINLYLKFMKKGATIVVTVKCLSKKVPNYIQRARKMLGKTLKIERIKVLPSNRQEFTVLATKN